METAARMPTLTFNHLPKAHSNGSWRRGNTKSLDWIQGTRETQNSTNYTECLEQRNEVPKPPSMKSTRESEKKTVPLKRAKKLERRIDRLEQDLLFLRSQKAELHDKYGVLMATNRDLNASLRQEQEKRSALQLEMQFLVRKLSGAQDQAMLFKREVQKGTATLEKLEIENLKLQKRVEELELNLYGGRVETKSHVNEGTPSHEVGEEKTWLMESDGLGVTETSQIHYSGNHVVLEELGVIWDSSKGFKFRGINNPHVEAMHR